MRIKRTYWEAIQLNSVCDCVTCFNKHRAAPERAQTFSYSEHWLYGVSRKTQKLFIYVTDDSQGQWQHWRREEVSRWSSREWTHRPPCWSRSRKWWTAAYLWLRPVKYNKNTHADTKTSAFISFWDEMDFWKTHHVLEVPVHNSSHLKECLNPKLKTQQYYIETSTFTRPPVRKPLATLESPVPF